MPKPSQRFPRRCEPSGLRLRKSLAIEKAGYVGNPLSTGRAAPGIGKRSSPVPSVGDNSASIAVEERCDFEEVVPAKPILMLRNNIQVVNHYAGEMEELQTVDFVHAPDPISGTADGPLRKVPVGD